jgi:tetratricopeptide (TPR) repeat protein
VDAFASVSTDILYNRSHGLPAKSPHHDPLALRAPWLHSEPADWMQCEDSQGKCLFDTARHSERYLLLTEGLGHVDYTSYALIAGRSAMKGYWGAANPEVLEGHKAVSRYISNFFAAFLMQDPKGLAFLSQDPKQAFPGSTMTLEHRPAAPALITYEELVQAVVAGEAEQAIERVRALRATAPDHILLSETYLERLVWSFRDTWGFDEKVMPVIKFRAELYPTSADALWDLAENHINIGDHPAAIEVYNRLLEQDPDDKDNYIKPRLEWLHSQ